MKKHILDIQKAHTFENEVLLITHREKDTHRPKIIAVDWIDINVGGKFNWLLCRLIDTKEGNGRRYKNIKYKNIDPYIEIRKREGWSLNETL